MTAKQNWANSNDEVWSVAAHHIDDELDTPRKMLAFFEKPWHYDNLFVRHFLDTAAAEPGGGASIVFTDSDRTEHVYGPFTDARANALVVVLRVELGDKPPPFYVEVRDA